MLVFLLGYWILLVFLLDVGYGVKVARGRLVCNVLLLNKVKRQLNGNWRNLNIIPIQSGNSIHSLSAIPPESLTLSHSQCTWHFSYDMKLGRMFPSGSRYIQLLEILKWEGWCRELHLIRSPNHW